MMVINTFTSAILHYIDGFISIVRFKKNSTERFKSYLDGQVH